MENIKDYYEVEDNKNEEKISYRDIYEIIKEEQKNRLCMKPLKILL